MKILGVISLILLSASCESEFDVPHTIRPERYSVVLTFPADLRTNTSFDGTVTLEFTALEAIRVIYLHSFGHDVTHASVYYENTLLKATAGVEIENDHVIRLVLSEELEVNEKYHLLMLFTGGLENDGIYRSEFENENGEIE
jgi:hypothetical protein